MGFSDGYIAKVTLRATLASGSDEQVNVLHYDGNGGALLPGDKPGSLQALADRLATDLLTPYRSMFSSSWTIQPVEVQEAEDPVNPSNARAAYTSGAAATGLRSITGGELLPRAMCGLAQLRTDYIGRSFRGRIYLGGSLMETDLLGEQWSDPAASNARYRWEAFINAIPLAPDIVWGPSTAATHLCVYSKTRRALQLDPYAPHVTSKTVSPGVHWLRSREP